MPNCTPSCLDLFITNTSHNVLLSDQVDTSLSHHDLIILSVSAFTKRPPKLPNTYRNYSKIDQQKLEDAIFIKNLANWHKVYLLTDADEQLSLLNDLVTILYEESVPLTQFTPRPINGHRSIELETLTISRDIAHKNWRRSNLSSDWDIFVEYRQKVELMEKKETYQRHSKLFDPLLNSKSLWRNIKELGINENTCQPQNLFSSADLNNFFVGVESVYSSPNSRLIDGPFSFRCINDCETIKAAMSVKSNAVGSDNLSPRFLKIIMQYITPIITHIFNNILTCSIYPKAWKSARVQPIPKVTNPTTINEYRPISILPYLSKVFERVLNDQINQYLSENNLLSPHQSGFRENRSTTTTLLYITEEMRRGLDNNLVQFLTLLDFSKAFDSVNHSKLITKLNNRYEMSPSACKLIHTYLHNRTQFVQQKDDISSTATLHRGVPQGSVLGPLLFSLYINDLPDVIKFSKCCMYADDVQLLTSGSVDNISTLAAHLNADLESIAKWARDNELTLNPLKSNYITVSSASLHKHISASTWTPINLTNVPIPRVSSAKNLGVWFDQHLQWDVHVTKLCGKIFGSVRRLWKVAWAMPLLTRKRLIRSLVFPIISYACTVYGSTTKTLMNNVTKAYNACLRFAYGIKNRRESISHLSIDFIGCSLKQFFDFESCCALHRIIITGKPEYLANYIEPSLSRRTFKLNTLTNKRKSGNGSVFIRGVKIWNCSPVALRRTHNLKQFRAACLEYVATLPP